jgi:hypothetical protein
MLRAALVLGLAAVSDAAVLNKKQPIMKLRGGISGVDANQVANVVAGITLANGAVMSLAPKKAGDMYGVATTKWTDFFAQWSGLMMFGQALVAILALGGMSFAEAWGWGMLPTAVASVQDLLNDRMVGELGMGAAARFMPVIINVGLTLAFFGKLSFLDAESALKFGAVWMGLNGAFGYAATDKWLEGWGGSGLSAVEAGMGKLMAQCMLGGAVFTGANVFMGKSVLESFGAMMGVYLLGSIDGIYVSKTMESRGVDANKGLFWAVLQAASVGAIFM